MDATPDTLPGGGSVNAQPVPPPARGRLQLSPLNRRRWQNFKKNGRGYWSLWIFGFLFFAGAGGRVDRQRQADRDPA
jgi:microcin C transport system permease protein